MNDEFNSNAQNPLEELDGAVRQAVAALRSSAPSDESLQRVVDRASRLPENQPITRRRWRLYTAASAIAIAATVMLAVLLVTPRDSWALVMQAVQMKPWVRCIAKSADGSQMENWISFSREVSGARSGAWAKFDDFKTKTREEYRPGEGTKGTLFREPMPEIGDLEEFKEMFIGAMRGNETIVPGLMPSGASVVSQERRRVVEQEKTWIDYDFVFRVVARDETIRCVFRVDPTTNLPASMKRSSLSDGPTEAFEMTIDYPDEGAGPRDIYDLGVPRDARLVDRLPSKKLSEVIAAVKRGQEQFGPYFAVVARTAGNMQPWQAVGVNLVWRKGPKMRVESVIFRAEPQKPVDGVKMLDWWKEQVNRPTSRFMPLYICDGTTLWRNEFEGPVKDDSKWKWKPLWSVTSHDFGPWGINSSAEYFPDVVSYGHPPQASGNLEVRLAENPPEGPPGCIVIERINTREQAGTYHKEQYWFDPNHSYLMRKYEWSDLRPADSEGAISNGHITETMEKSPNGLWYSSCIRQTPILREKPGAVRPMAMCFWYYVDFNAKLPDSLFKPEERTGRIE